jgi:uncharacterized membrane protein
MHSKTYRVREIDFLRGFAILLMIGFHCTYDLQYFAKFNLSLPEAYWKLMPEFIGSLFFSVVGVSAWLTYLKDPPGFKKTLLKRSLYLLAISFLITLTTLFFDPKNIIYFGALHCIGSSLFLLPFFSQSKRWTPIWGCFFIALGLFLWQFKLSHPYFLWLGLAPLSGTGGDWFSLFPYFGVVLIGFSLGERLYPFQRPPNIFISHFISHTSIFRLFSFFGRHSLLIYLVHQPILIGLIQNLPT